jgi:hypothetical protein
MLRTKRSFFMTGLFVVVMLCSLLLLINTASGQSVQYDINPPAQPVRLIFVHHSTGENWLADDNGRLGLALLNNNYFVSDTNYGWGPDSIGDNTDIGNWWQWFRGPNSASYMNALYNETGQNSSYSRLATTPPGQNGIVMFKSCFPNSALQGSPGDPVPLITNNPLRGESSGSSYHTVANAKGIYTDLLNYFSTRQDKLFVVITAPPLTDPTYSANARAFNEWLVNEWLQGYSYKNVAVFDFYNVLTTNGGNPNTNDLGSASGNHHRWWNNTVQHKTDGDNDADLNISEYPTDDDHPSQAGNLKATGEFINLLNIFYNDWKQSQNTVPTLGTLTPATITTTADIARTFTAIYSDADGYADIKQAYLKIHTAASGIYLRYDRTTNKLYLYNDAGTATAGNCTPGAAKTLTNARGSLNCAATTTAVSGNNLTINWNITPGTTFADGTNRNIYMYVKDVSNLTAGWTDKGDWTIKATNTAPILGTLTPSVLVSAPDIARIFTAIYGDADGYANIKQAYLRVHTAASGIYLRYDRTTNKLYLYNDAGTATAGNCTPGAAKTLTNARGSLNCAATTTAVSGNKLTIKWNITPKEAFASATARDLYMYVRDMSNLTRGWIDRGDWTITPP